MLLSICGVNGKAVIRRNSKWVQSINNDIYVDRNIEATAGVLRVMNTSRGYLSMGPSEALPTQYDKVSESC
jgi:hypothetical protein